MKLIYWEHSQHFHVKTSVSSETSYRIYAGVLSSLLFLSKGRRLNCYLIHPHSTTFHFFFILSHCSFVFLNNCTILLSWHFTALLNKWCQLKFLQYFLLNFGTLSVVPIKILSKPLDSCSYFLFSQNFFSFYSHLFRVHVLKHLKNYAFLSFSSHFYGT